MISEVKKLLTVAIVIMAVATGCGSRAYAAEVSVTSDSPLTVRTESPVFQKDDSGIWFQHDLTLENTSDRAIVVDYSHTGDYLDDYGLLATDPGCGYGEPDASDVHPSISCTAVGRLPLTVAPHASTKLSTIAVWKGLEGMASLKSGTYVWNREIQWHFSDTPDLQKCRLTITYAIT